MEKEAATLFHNREQVVKRVISVHLKNEECVLAFSPIKHLSAQMMRLTFRERKQFLKSSQAFNMK